MTRNLNEPARDASTKVPEVTLAFWIIKIAATALGETGGDSVTMTLDWGDQYFFSGSFGFEPLLANEDTIVVGGGCDGDDAHMKSLRVCKR
jgi:hypothetical protein